MVARVKAKTVIELSNGDRIPLGHAIETGRVKLVVFYAWDRKTANYYARELDTLWPIGEKLYTARGGYKQHWWTWLGNEAFRRADAQGRVMWIRVGCGELHAFV
jgi:hypothetical protein